MSLKEASDLIFPLGFVVLFAWIIHAGNHKGIKLFLMVLASVVFTVGFISALAGMVIFPKPFAIAATCCATAWIAGIYIKREPKIKQNHPDWLINKIESDLRAVELTKNPTAVEGYKKELLELLKKHNINPPSDIQKLLIPTTSQPHPSDTRQ